MEDLPITCYVNQRTGPLNFSFSNCKKGNKCMGLTEVYHCTDRADGGDLQDEELV